MTDVVMPQMGESIVEGTLTKWLKKPGERIERDEPLFEISTDKVDAEIPAPAAGTLTEILVREGQSVSVLAVVGRGRHLGGRRGVLAGRAAPGGARGNLPPRRHHLHHRRAQAASGVAAPTIAIKDCSFAPTVTRVPIGARVTWKNADYLPHVVSGVGWGSVNGSAGTEASTLQPGATFAQLFTTPGLYPYTSYLHPGMSGVVIVGDQAAAGSAAIREAPSEAPWSYLLIALFGVLAIGGYGIALVRRF